MVCRRNIAAPARLAGNGMKGSGTASVFMVSFLKFGFNRGLHGDVTSHRLDSVRCGRKGKVAMFIGSWEAFVVVYGLLVGLVRFSDSFNGGHEGENI